MKYKVYFEIFGKKMRTEVSANCPDSAKKAIRNKIIFYKVEEQEDEVLSRLKDMFGMR